MLNLLFIRFPPHRRCQSADISDAVSDCIKVLSQTQIQLCRSFSLAVMSTVKLTAVNQDIFRHKYPPIYFTTYEEHLLSSESLDTLLESSYSTVLGLSASYNSKSELSCLAVATDTLVLLIKLPTRRSKTARSTVKGALEQRILSNPAYTKLAFDCERLTTALFLDHGYFVNNAIDIESLVVPRTVIRGSIASLQIALGGQKQLNIKGLSSAFRQNRKKENEANRSLALRAWSSFIISSSRAVIKTLPAARIIDTSKIPLPARISISTPSLVSFK